MSLLPKSHADFAKGDFWEGFFKKRGDKAFEWYGEYGQLCGILHKYIKTSDKVLNVGCGNSSLSADMYDVGYHDITNIDISDVAIRQMTDKNAEQRPDMKFIKMDIFKLEFSANDFSVVLDKGTLDAIFTDEKEETLDKVTQMFDEIGRVLRIGGRYICVSLAQEHIVRKMLSYFTQEGWMVRVCRVQEETSAKDFHMPVFVYVLTKFKKMPTMKPILEVAYFENKAQRFESVEEVQMAIKEMQHYGIIRQKLNKQDQVNDSVVLDLYSSASSSPRYTIHVVNQPHHAKNKKFAIFIVPEGRETEWLFADPNGQKQLATSAGFDRLAIVLLNRNHTYTDLDSIKLELSVKVMELAPPGLGDNKQVPFLSVGNDINMRTVRHEGHSELSGDYVVEDVDTDGKMHRQLIFLSNSKVVQSSARLKKEISRAKSGKKKKGPPRSTIDKSYLACSHHNVMVAGLSLLTDLDKRLEIGLSALLVGLGGGGLAVFIRQYIPKLLMEVVEIDPAIVTVATDWFGFTPDDHLKVHVADGLEFIQKEATAEKCAKRDVVMLDVNSHDATVAMSCPPEAFVQNDFLQAVKASLKPEGLLMVNMACRDTNVRMSVLDNVKAVFPMVYIQDISVEVNEVIFARPELISQPAETQKEILENSVKILQKTTQAQAKGAAMPELAELLNNLKLL